VQRGRAKHPERGFIFPLFLFLLVTTLAPIVYVVVLSLFNNYLPSGRVTFAGFAQYAHFLSDAEFWKSVGNTATYVVASTAFHIFVAIALAVLLDRSGKRFTVFASGVRNILIVPWLLSWAVAAALWRLILSPSGVLNAYLMQIGFIERQVAWFGTPGVAMTWIVAITVWKAFPFFFMLVYAAVTTVPTEMYESAEIDGAGWLQRFWYITLPGIFPTVLTLIVLDVIWSLRQYDIIFLTTAGGPLNTTRTLTLQVYFTAYEELRFGRAAAQGVFILVVASVLAFIYIVLYERLEAER
jgi:multiple sugar transport system permease protein